MTGVDSGASVAAARADSGDRSDERAGIAVWPATAQLRPGDPLEVVVDGEAGSPVGLRVLEGTTAVAGVEVPPAPAGIRASGGPRRVTLRLPGGASRAAYAIEAQAASGARATSAVDVAPHWWTAPRYGFLSDFAPDEAATESTRRADALLRLHVNVVQFYDWMASHHTFLGPSPEFTDPLGRRLSHTVVRRKIDLLHARGTAALAYGAVYGAEADFSREHPDWLLYDGRGEPLSLAETFYLQDFAPPSPWRGWILDQYDAAVAALGFDGIHVDQYGFPKHARSRAGGAWHTVDLSAQLPGFVAEAAERVRRRRPEGGVIFNCVNAWPLESLAGLRDDAATYIEVWEPHTRFRDLYELVRRARMLRPGMSVILAAYLRPFHPDQRRDPGALTALRLTSAAIGASGGFSLLLGEGDGVLADPYYPRYGRLDRHEAQVVRRYADFAVRNTTRLHDPSPTDIAWTHVGPANGVITLHHAALESYGAGAVPGSLWVIGRRAGTETILQLVNLRGLATDAWNAEQPSGPTPLTELEVRVRIVGGVAGVWWDTPDDDAGTGRALAFDVTDTAEGRFLVFRVPRIDVWSCAWWRESDETDLP